MISRKKPLSVFLGDFSKLCNLRNHRVTYCMSFVISSLQPFPSINWWGRVLETDRVLWDIAEHFEKMSFRNRYAISTANGLVKLSVPLLGGRDQRSAVKDIIVSNVQDWQTQHWRTLVSAYN